jgi:transposase
MSLKKTRTAQKHLTISQPEYEVLTIGLDLGDRTSYYCLLNSKGDVVAEGSLTSKPATFRTYFAGLRPCRIAFEVGGHSRWANALLNELGYEVIVANASQVRLIYDSSRKTDRVDARTLARLARLDPSLLSPIQHRNSTAQAQLCIIRARQVLVAARTQLINCVRGMVKSFGERLPACSSDNFSDRIDSLLQNHFGRLSNRFASKLLY